MDRTFKIGDKVWTREHWSSLIVSAEIIGFVTKDVDGKSVTYAELQNGGIWGRKMDELYSSKQEAIDAYAKKDRDEVDAYKAEIQSVEDLISFMYNHTVCHCEEYTDWEARKAARERANELLGVDLGN